MLTIEHCDIEEQILIGDLFEQVGLNGNYPTNNEGESFINNEWPIEVLSLDGYYQIEGFRLTKNERQLRVSLSELDLLCSPEHVVLSEKGWMKIGNLIKGDKILTRFGFKKIENIEIVDGEKRLCDLQVSISHSYYTNDIMSHNSHFLTFVGASALKAQKNVLHYTLELSETQIGVRYDSNLCSINSNEVLNHVDEIKEKYQNMKLGRLFIKQFPMHSATVYTLRSHVERLSVSKNFIPDLIIIDYADIMRSTRSYDSLRHELKLVYEELRSWATEINVPLWTASQSNREGASSDIVDLTNMSESYGKAMTADFVISISRKPEEKSTGHGRLYVAKNRSGKDGILWPCNIDTSMSNFAITGTPGSLAEEREHDTAAIKSHMRNRWNELNNDPSLKV